MASSASFGISSPSFGIFNIPHDMTEDELRKQLPTTAKLIALNQGKLRRAIVEFERDGSQSEVNTFCKEHNFLLMPWVGDTATVSIHKDWLTMIHEFGLKVQDFRQPEVIIKQSGNGITLEGKLADVNRTLCSIEQSVVDSFVKRVKTVNGGMSNGHLTDITSANSPRFVADVSQSSRSGSDSLARARLNGLEAASWISHPNNAGLSVQDSITTIQGSDKPLSNHLPSKPDSTGSSVDSTPHDLMYRSSRTADETDLLTPRKKQYAEDMCTHDIEEHAWRFIQFKYSLMSKQFTENLKPKLSSSGRVFTLTGTKQDYVDFKDWYRKHDINSVVREIKSLPQDVDEHLFNRLISRNPAKTCDVLVEYLKTGDIELIGKSADIRKLHDWLFTDVTHLRDYLPKTDQHLMSDRSQKDNDGMYAVSQGSLNTSGSVVNGHSVNLILHSTRDTIVFVTPEANIRTEIACGNLTNQQTDVIVNPVNRHLAHCGGAAKAIADAAGYALQKECKDYIKTHRRLPTAEVMHTTAGQLPRPIKHVIHACGPNIKDFPDLKSCQQILTKTFFNCLVYANNKLLVRSVALPAISSGTYGVPFDVVGEAAFTALMAFDNFLSENEIKKRHVTTVKFVNIDRDITQSLVRSFTKSLQKVMQSISNSKAQQSSLINDTQVTASESSKTHVPLVKNVSTDHKSSQDTNCSTCGKKKQLFVRQDCPHKACVVCINSCCTKCLPAGISRQNIKDDDRSPVSHVSADHKLPISPSDDTEKDVTPERYSRPRQRSGSFRVTSSRSPKDQSSPSSDDSAQKDNLTSADVQKDTDEFSNLQLPRRANSLTKHDRKKYDPKKEVELCVICMDKITEPKVLDCGHKFCDDCIKQALTHANKCPVCGRIFGKLRGNQPSGGTMKVHRSRDDLVGFKGFGSLVINYDIPSGFQQSNHPHPGRPFKGTRRTAYLPRNAEGEEICKLLREAFDAGLIFTIGRSVTTGEEDVVVWNDIHHKTSKTGTYGYPDYTYLSRVRDELGAKGITSASKSAGATVSTAYDSTSTGASKLAVSTVGTTYGSTSAGTNKLAVATASTAYNSTSAGASKLAVATTSTAYDSMSMGVTKPAVATVGTTCGSVPSGYSAAFSMSWAGNNSDIDSRSYLSSLPSDVHSTYVVPSSSDKYSARRDDITTNTSSSLFSSISSHYNTVGNGLTSTANMSNGTRTTSSSVVNTRPSTAPISTSSKSSGSYYGDPNMYTSKKYNTDMDRKIHHSSSSDVREAYASGDYATRNSDKLATGRDDTLLRSTRYGSYGDNLSTERNVDRQFRECKHGGIGSSNADLYPGYSSLSHSSSNINDSTNRHYPRGSSAHSSVRHVGSSSYSSLPQSRIWR